MLEDPLSEKVLYKEFPAGATVLIDIDPEDPEKLSFTSVETPDQPPLEMVDKVE
jgi:hypothetical protein